MSYLEMKSCPLTDTNKMIISFWFREISKQKEKPPTIKQWKQGFWGGGIAGKSDTLIPPNAQYLMNYDGAYNCTTGWYNPFGIPSGGIYFGGLFMGPAMVWIPCAPPAVTNTWAAKGSIINGDPADVNMNDFGVRTLLVFGDPNIPYETVTWERHDPGVIDFVDYTIPAAASGAGIIMPITPPPYKVHPQGGPCKGQWKVVDWKTKGGTTSRGKVPPSFIGINEAGKIVINLQTNTKATYKGMAFQPTKSTNIMASQTHLEIRGPPYSYGQLGFPFPDGDWVSVDGYWNGYQFEYEDISDRIMQCAPESFVITAQFSGLVDFGFSPTIQDGGWHHLVFSFDISGAVNIETPSVETQFSSKYVPAFTAGNPMVGATDCQAWMAVDDVEVAGGNLQNSCGVNDGFRLPQLRGTETTAIFACGPTAAYNRGGGNDTHFILPRNAWLHGWGGNPKDGMIGNASVSPIIDNTMPNNPGYVCSSNMELGNCFGTSNGDYSVMGWTGAIWPLYGGCRAAAPGPWHGTSTPKKPDREEPSRLFEHPQYHCSGFTIPLAGHPIGVPCSTGSEPTDIGAVGVVNNTGLEMAELQIWVGQSLDVGKEANRRLFIDKNGKPTALEEARKKLGRPDVLLHGSGNWKAGRNTGKSGVSEDGQTIQSGQFEAVADIKTFVPNPELGK